jgi:hypothetical protein
VIPDGTLSVHSSSDLGWKEHNVKCDLEIAAVTAPLPAQDAFMERINLSLVPYFAVTHRDTRGARDAAVGALMDYATRIWADIPEAARIVAFSFTALESLGDATIEWFPCRCAFGCVAKPTR